MSWSILLLLILGSVLLQPCLSLVDIDDPTFGQPTVNPHIPHIPVPRPYRLPPDEEMRYSPLPSMITAIAPSASMVDNGTYETLWSMHYHNAFTKRRQGVGIFQRGVFANDPPIATCTPCGFQGTGLTTNSNITTPPATATCTTHTYLGVFRSKVGGSAGTSTQSYCYDTVYSGVFVSVTTSSTGLPCCFTIPASCLPNNSSSTSYTYSSGVFRPSSTPSASSNATTTSSSTGSPSTSSSRSSTVSSTTTSSSLRSRISSSSTSTITVIVSTLRGSGTSSTASTAAVSSLVSSSDQISTSSTFDPGTLTSAVIISNDGPRPGSASPVTLSVVTIQPTTTITPSPITTTVDNTIYGCGTASGSGVINGTGTVYVYPLGLPVVSSGLVSGYASKVVGCGTLYATTGTFTGSATIVACGYGSGSGTIMGSGTVWPAALGGMIPIISRGTVTGSGAVTGCGTIIGSGTFTATEGFITTITPPASTAKSTIEVYISSCAGPDMGMGMPRIVGNVTVDDDGTATDDGRASPTAARVFSNGTQRASNGTSGNTTIDNPLCQVCGNDVGTCCPLASECGADGHCPWPVMQNAGYAFAGLYNIVAVKNSSGMAKRGAPVPEQVVTVHGW